MCPGLPPISIGKDVGSTCVYSLGRAINERAKHRLPVGFLLQNLSRRDSSQPLESLVEFRKLLRGQERKAEANGTVVRWRDLLWSSFFDRVLIGRVQLSLNVQYKVHRLHNHIEYRIEPIFTKPMKYSILETLIYGRYIDKHGMNDFNIAI